MARLPGGNKLIFRDNRLASWRDHFLLFTLSSALCLRTLSIVRVKLKKQVNRDEVERTMWRGDDVQKTMCRRQTKLVIHYASTTRHDSTIPPFPLVNSLQTMLVCLHARLGENFARGYGAGAGFFSATLASPAAHSRTL